MGERRTRLIRARKAAYYTQETLAYALNVDPTTVGHWERGKSEPLPYKRPKLAKLLGVDREQLEELLAEGQNAPSAAGSAAAPPPADAVTTSGDLDYDTWADDLDRAAVCLGRQEFVAAKLLLDRWTGQLASGADQRALHLYGRSLRLLGDLRQDQGVLTGPLSARQSYRKAMAVFAELHSDRRVAQLELHLAVLDEMSGQLEAAGRQYERLAADHRLDARDRTRALLWVGTALSKAGEGTAAITFIRPAIRRFEALEEPQDWSVAYQKLALAYRGDGDLRQATAALEVALDHRAGDAPMQRVRLDTAHGHLLLSDPATADSGLALLEGAAATATEYGMLHQLQAITGIRRAYEQQA
ncbi:helix-turn-helix transcriptional regulator [Amycolatopsis vancoresmycina]|uniref:helix-turn-helix transcriptional regulator n=1 Tax=Amycolatopsis vancoresmycina TaxID=208444 RepID=UPI0003A1732E|nr:helix-turn-helix transcriptional regulator [Amycolatopsis vancoresmycina]